MASCCIHSSCGWAVKSKESVIVFSGSLLLCVCVPVLEVELTWLLDKQGVNLFDIFNPEVLPRDVSALYHCFSFCHMPFFGL